MALATPLVPFGNTIVEIKVFNFNFTDVFLIIVQEGRVRAEENTIRDFPKKQRGNIQTSRLITGYQSLVVLRKNSSEGWWYKKTTVTAVRE